MANYFENYTPDPEGIELFRELRALVKRREAAKASGDAEALEIVILELKDNRRRRDEKWLRNLAENLRKAEESGDEEAIDLADRELAMFRLELRERLEE